MSKEKPRWLILWRHNGVNYWEAVPDNKMEAFIEKLLLVDKVNPATIGTLDLFLILNGPKIGIMNIHIMNIGF